jgi:DNA processing protein
VASTCLLPLHPAYPKALLHLPAPPTIWVRGAWPAPAGVAIVGARAASPDACDFAHDLARDLARAGVAVYSGGAVGIDAAAHRGALAGGGFTALFHAGGHGRPSPEEHASLFEEVVASGGAVVARRPDGEAAIRPDFLRRNSILAAMSVALVVVAAGQRGGARAAVGCARRLGRPVGAVPGAPWDSTGYGCAQELVRGAKPVLEVSDVLALAGLAAMVAPAGPPSEELRAGARPATPPPPRLDLTPLEARVFDVLGAAPLHLDVIAGESGLSEAELATTLLTLALRAVVVEGPSGSYRRAAPGAWRT